jgi:hypothetical protein
MDTYYLFLSLVFIKLNIFLPDFDLSRINSSLDLQGLILFGKPLWDWIALLVAPVLLTIFGLALQGILKRQDEIRRRLDELRSESNLQNASMRQYFDQIVSLIKNQDSISFTPKDYMLAKALTATLLKKLSPENKEEVLFFLTGQSEVLSGSRLRSRPSRIVYPGACEG